MAAHIKEQERVVLLPVKLGFGQWSQRGVGRQQRGHGVFPAAAGRLAPNLIGEAPPGHLVEPATGIVRSALSRPLPCRGNEGFLNRILGLGKVTMPARDCSEHLRRQCAQQVPEFRFGEARRHASGRGPSITWRTSIGMPSGVPPGPGAADALPASS